MDGAGGTEGRGSSLPKRARLTGSEEIRTLLRRGKRRRTRHVDVFISASPVSHSRFGTVVPKPRQKSSPGKRRVRGAAVQRNRLKRRLREIGRRELLPFLEASGVHLDLLVRARPEAYGVGFEELKAELIEIREWLCSSVS